MGLAFSVIDGEGVEYNAEHIRSQLVDMVRDLLCENERAVRLSIGERDRSIYSDICFVQRAS